MDGRKGRKMTDKEALNWVADRIVNVYKESENVDFVLRLRKIADVLSEIEAKVYQIKKLREKENGEYADAQAEIEAKNREIAAWIKKHFEELQEKDRDSLVLRQELAALTEKLRKMEANELTVVAFREKYRNCPDSLFKERDCAAWVIIKMLAQKALKEADHETA
jgi:hypothetical protein